MAYLDQTEDTICAPATPPGFGGIAVVRVSGPKALDFFLKISSLKNQSIEPRKAYFTTLQNNHKILDEVLFTYFEKGHSYTGESTVEISCHGSPVVVEEILQALISSGCRLALKGEFTFRAFMNGKIDLVQAESVLSLIESQTSFAHQASLRQLKGELSNKIKEIQKKLQLSLAHLEANIDFTLEDLETMSEDEIRIHIEDSLNLADKLVESYTTGKVISDSFRIALAGEPNVGKSSLFNQLVRQDRAIVTPIAGTTRDTIEASIVFNGYKLCFVDTAGLRDTNDVIEKLGIDKSMQELGNADLIFYVFDMSKEVPLDFSEVSQFKNKVIFVGNKSDKKIPRQYNMDFCEVSAFDEKSLQCLWDVLALKLKETLIDSSVVVLKQRQFELLRSLQDSLQKANNELTANMSSEFVALEIRQALEACYEILGEKFDDQTLQKVFQEFCIGK